MATYCLHAPDERSPSMSIYYLNRFGEQKWAQQFAIKLAKAFSSQKGTCLFDTCLMLLNDCLAERRSPLHDAINVRRLGLDRILTTST